MPPTLINNTIKITSRRVCYHVAKEASMTILDQLPTIYHKATTKFPNIVMCSVETQGFKNMPSVGHDKCIVQLAIIKNVVEDILYCCIC